MGIRVAITDPETRKFKKKLLDKIRDVFPYVDVDDCEVAIYWYCHDWHNGQWSLEYKTLCGSYYKPSCLATGIESESDLAQEAYNILVLEFAKKVQ